MEISQFDTDFLVQSFLWSRHMQVLLLILLVLLLILMKWFSIHIMRILHCLIFTKLNCIYSCFYCITIVLFLWRIANKSYQSINHTSCHSYVTPNNQFMRCINVIGWEFLLPSNLPPNINKKSLWLANL